MEDDVAFIYGHLWIPSFKVGHLGNLFDLEDVGLGVCPRRVTVKFKQRWRAKIRFLYKEVNLQKVFRSCQIN